MRFAFATAYPCACVVAAVTSCGTNELQPIRDPPALDGASQLGHDAAPADAALDSGPVGEVASRCKRGFASNLLPTAAVAPGPSSPGISWWYNWSSQDPGGEPSIEFVPMIWGGRSLIDSLPKGSRYVLGFNEPNFNTQANLTAQQAAAGWPQLEAKAKAAGIPTVSPSVNFCANASSTSQCTDPAVTDPYTYLKDFFAGCAGCKVDYIGVHARQCDLPSLRAYLEGNLDAGGTLEGFMQFGKPLWITEIACDATHSLADQKAFMQAAVPYLESDPNVVRYAWFSAREIPNAMLTNTDGTSSDLGKIYVGLPQSCR